jgi:diaminohydroxyphosphoribosylaminopyrimidine deaminase / 5-amino-6-(5-phosphoribosylamino)uracil reductase
MRSFLMPDDTMYMSRAIELAASAPFTSPNPRVGAIVVAGGRIVGEGRHDGPGLPHAERIALADVPAGATLYVTLEPCSHEGRTPPCAPFVIERGVQRVVVAMEDPDERVRGQGVELLRAAGVEVEVGLLEERARALNLPYIHHRRTGLPWVTLKLALSLDGRMAARDGSSRWITGPAARERVHRRRAEVDAVMVGAQTVLADDPALTARDVGAARQPARIVLDASGVVPASARVFSQDADAIVATTRRAPSETRKEWARVGAEVLLLDEAEPGVDLQALLKNLGSRDFLEVYCEGGARLASSLLAGDLVDRLELNYGPVVLGRGGPEIGDVGVERMASARRLRVVAVEALDDDVLVVLERGEGR